MQCRAKLLLPCYSSMFPFEDHPVSLVKMVHIRKWSNSHHFAWVWLDWVSQYFSGICSNIWQKYSIQQYWQFNHFVDHYKRAKKESLPQGLPCFSFVVDKNYVSMMNLQLIFGMTMTNLNMYLHFGCCMRKRKKKLSEAFFHEVQALENIVQACTNFCQTGIHEDVFSR